MIIRIYRGFTIRQSDMRGYFATSSIVENDFSDYENIGDIMDAIDYFLDYRGLERAS